MNEKSRRHSLGYKKKMLTEASRAYVEEGKGIGMDTEGVKTIGECSTQVESASSCMNASVSDFNQSQPVSSLQ